jgi:hypothetical protein
VRPGAIVSTVLGLARPGSRATGQDRPGESAVQFELPGPAIVSLYQVPEPKAE